MPNDKSSRIVVVGAGVIGLTCALVLAEKGYKVSVIADHFPTDPDSASEFTSIWAGAHFRPFPSVTESDARESGYTRKTLNFFKSFSKECPESSIRFIKGTDWLEKPSKGYTDLHPTYKRELEDFQVTSDGHSLPSGVNFACSYKTWVINAPMYVQFLFRRLSYKYNVEFVHQRLSSLKQVYSIYDNIGGIINATAFGLQYERGYDPLTFPIRGQTLVLRVPPNCPYINETITHQGKDGSWTFVINRPCDGGCILGGTKQVNDLNPLPREADIEAVKERARKLFPELFVKTNPDGTKDLDIIIILP